MNEWDTAGEWFDVYLLGATPKELLEALIDIREYIEDEDLIDVFGDTMEEWGYFAGREEEYDGYKMTNKQAISEFNEGIRPVVAKVYGNDDRVAMREAFNNWTDRLCKDGVITMSQYETWEGPEEDA